VNYAPLLNSLQLIAKAIITNKTTMSNLFILRRNGSLCGVKQMSSFGISYAEI
jgi:hypothetical protein